MAWQRDVGARVRRLAGRASLEAVERGLRAAERSASSNAWYRRSLRRVAIGAALTAVALLVARFTVELGARPAQTLETLAATATLAAMVSFGGSGIAARWEQAALRRAERLRRDLAELRGDGPG